MRAQDDADLLGAILNPLRSKSLEQHTHQSLSLLFETLYSSRERDERERLLRCFREKDFVAKDSLFERPPFLQIPQIINSGTTHEAKAFLEREKNSRACKMRDTKSTPKLLDANKKTKRE